MTLDDYQAQALSTAQPLGDYRLPYTALKLPGEAGEFSEKLGKLIRDEGWRPGQEIAPGKREALAKELGDVLWYVAVAASELGYSLDEIAHGNGAKLRSRAERGVLGGSGDSR